MANSTQDSVNLTQGAPTVGVGQSLKTARETMGKSIAEVAAQLRIREPFLQALEDGRHRDLPGGTYAIGFLRTYAEFLDLDGEEMVRRFRAEAASDLNARSELVFPSPMSEGRIPGGAVLFLGVVAAAIAYGVWYFLSSSSTDVAEMVPPLPDRLASVLNRQAKVTADAPKPAEAPKTETTVPTKDRDEDGTAPAPVSAKDMEVVPPQEEEDSKSPAPAPTPASPAASQPVTPPATSVTAPAANTGKVEVPKVDSVQQIETSKPNEAFKPATATPPAPPAPPPPAPIAAAPTQPAATAVESAVSEGKVLGQEHTDSRIQMKAANDDCWVQVREMDGQLLLSRLLRRGDSYIVPNRPGLTLMVGNAGALDILVDGKKAPALGNNGQVRRDIKLDPDKLLGGG